MHDTRAPSQDFGVLVDQSQAITARSCWVLPGALPVFVLADRQPELWVNISKNPASSNVRQFFRRGARARKKKIELYFFARSFPHGLRGTSPFCVLLTLVGPPVV